MLNKKNIIEIISDQRKKTLPEPNVNRSIFDKLLSYKKNPHVIVLTGLRRSGKSTLLNQLKKKIKSDYYLNFDDDRLVNFELSDFQLVLESFIELYGEQRNIFFDEIQNIPGWERFVRRLHESNYKVFITGSNADMLSKELGTRLTGRSLALELYPFSFIEFLEFYKYSLKDIKQFTTVDRGKIKQMFNKFVNKGGIPELLHTEEKDIWHNLYTNIIYRDIIVRHNIKNDGVFRKFVHYLATLNSSEVSFSSSAKILGIKNTSTITDYAHYLEESYLCYFLPRFSYSVKKQINYPKKVYFVDHAMVSEIGFRFSENRGRILENIVFLELKRRGKEIYFHKEKKECDFITVESGKINQIIQVCQTMKIYPQTREREIESLKEAMLMYEQKEGFIITEDEYEELEIKEGRKKLYIHIIPIWEWLISDTYYL